MPKARITVLRRMTNPDIVEEYMGDECKQNILPCRVFKDGQEFIVEDLRMPEDFCTSAWVSIYSNIRLLSFGGDLPWFKEKGVAITCCIDGLRPVILKLERI